MKTLEELKAIREKMQSQVSMREEDHARTRVLVGMATCGIASGARPVLKKHDRPFFRYTDRLYRFMPV